jgi:hypothetical protein
MKSKQISDRSNLTIEQKALRDVLKEFDFQTEQIISFFDKFYKMTLKEVKSHKNPLAPVYRKIAKEMLPLEA